MKDKLRGKFIVLDGPDGCGKTTQAGLLTEWLQVLGVPVSHFRDPGDTIIGEKIRQIAAKRQVLCITHLPQVAAPANSHYVVTKRVQDGRTTSEIELLDKKSRITELARMLGGQSDAARKHAEVMLK